MRDDQHVLRGDIVGERCEENLDSMELVVSSAKDLLLAGQEQVLRCAQDDSILLTLRYGL